MVERVMPAHSENPAELHRGDRLLGWVAALFGCVTLVAPLLLLLIVTLGSAYAGGGHGGSAMDRLLVTFWMTPPVLLSVACFASAVGAWRGRRWAPHLLTAVDVFLFCAGAAFLILVTLPDSRAAYTSGSSGYDSAFVGVGTVTSLFVLAAAAMLGLALGFYYFSRRSRLPA
jgi:hypothetical protein